MDIYELHEKGLLALQQDEDLAALHVSDSAVFAGHLTLGENVYIEATQIGGNCVIEDDVMIGKEGYIGSSTTVEHNANLENGIVVGGRNRIGAGSILLSHVILEEGIDLPHEAQIGPDIVVPSQDTIVTLGRFGTSNRVVTIHGSDDGPRFSIGCQYSVPESVITYRITNATQTSSLSAAHYQLFLPVFSAIGARVQQYYDQEARHIEDLRGKADELRRRTHNRHR